jgi:hypothetical protein
MRRIDQKLVSQCILNNERANRIVINGEDAPRRTC